MDKGEINILSIS